MKSNVNLYLPWSAVAEVMPFQHGRLITSQPIRPGLPVVSIEEIDGGCKLYRLVSNRASERRRSREVAR
jgi:hypothetical protein